MTSTAVQRAIQEHGLLPIPDTAAEQLSNYIDLLLKWNARVNLTAIRDPEEILARHVVEGVFTAQFIPQDCRTLLDFGSGAGIPGIPIAVCRPEMAVLLAESQQKKAAFLREAARVLATSFEVHAGRVEELSQDRRFEVVTMRAVERMSAAVQEAAARVRQGGRLFLLSTDEAGPACIAALPEISEWERIAFSRSKSRLLLIGRVRGAA